MEITRPPSRTAPMAWSRASAAGAVQRGSTPPGPWPAPAAPSRRRGSRTPRWRPASAGVVVARAGHTERAGPQARRDLDREDAAHAARGRGDEHGFARLQVAPVDQALRLVGGPGSDHQSGRFGKPTPAGMGASRSAGAHRQFGRTRHGREQDSVHRSPGRRSAPSPAASTTPAISWPGTNGSVSPGKPPLTNPTSHGPGPGGTRTSASPAAGPDQHSPAPPGQPAQLPGSASRITCLPKSKSPSPPEGRRLAATGRRWSERAPHPLQRRRRAWPDDDHHAAAEATTAVQTWLGRFDQALTSGNAEAVAGLVHRGLLLARPGRVHLEHRHVRGPGRRDRDAGGQPGPGPAQRVADHRGRGAGRGRRRDRGVDRVRDGGRPGRGHLRLRSGRAQAWTLLTTLYELKGYEEPRPRPAQGGPARGQPGPDQLAGGAASRRQPSWATTEQASTP